ncbi:MAG: preprotein translocase subunit SecG [Firmicutes bacterium HGW-Firmicutes-1]|nr:MAG: preprotein translocase subunit SecG [Firmicutes bacterium HGW-Firmicutes-1]
METLEFILKIVYFLDCVALVGIVLLQQGKVTGLSGVIGGAGESYWGKNKARSMEGGLHKATVAIAVLFMILSVALNLI